MLNQRSLDRLKGVKQILIDILIEAAKDSPYEFQIPPDGGLRTAARQKELFDKGASKLDGINKIGKHQKGEAYDIYLNKEVGMAMWDKAKLTKVQRHIKEVAFDMGYELSLGCDWKKKPTDEFGWDCPHGELK
jgi:hypothetical protein